MPADSRARVFLSHSSADKEFVRRLKADLEQADLDVWLDEVEIQVGDSIPQKVSEGLSDSDYVVVVLSESSVKSKWVLEELNTALMAQIDGSGVIVLPVKIADCEVPTLLKSRLYADFQYDYDAGFARLRRVFELESTVVAPTAVAAPSTCAQTLAALMEKDLLRRLARDLSRKQVALQWFKAIGGRMDDELPEQPNQNCIMELLLRTSGAKRGELLKNLCEDHPSLAS